MKQVLLECSRYVDAQREAGEAGLSRADLLDALERRVSLALGKLVAAPTCTSFCVYRASDDSAVDS